jgi:SMODS-associating 2TM, beta-strand rich effector domain
MAMYKVIPHKVLFLVIAWLVFGCVSLVNAIDEIVKAEWLRSGQAVSIAWILISLLVMKPVWRWIWKKIPKMNEWVYPDLNGEWDVEMMSNWSIQQQLIKAAANSGEIIDVEKCPVCDLADLLPIKLKADINQSWFKIEIKIWNPRNDSPIRRSDVISADPFGSDGLKPSGLFYFFKQENATANLADDTEFFGAARVEYDQKTNRLHGLFWTARMWDRGMNTAGRIAFNQSNAN